MLGSEGGKRGDSDGVGGGNDGNEDGEKEDSEEAMVLLPYCVVHPRIDTNVSKTHRVPGILLRGTLVNRTYGGNKNLYIHLFLVTRFGPIYYRPP